MKTIQEIYTRRTRAYQASTARATREAMAAHPATGGHWGMVHNWGNDEARAAIERHHVRWARLDAKFDRQYHKALHDTHARNNYLWCSYCRAAK